MYLAQITKDRIRQLCKTKNINIENMLKECSLGANAVRQISDTKGMASFSLAKIADYLNCSVDYLLGRTDTIELLSMPNRLAEALISVLGEKQDFYSLDDIIVYSDNENYYILRDDFRKILEIYNTAKKFDCNIMDKNEFKNMFETAFVFLLNNEFNKYFSNDYKDKENEKQIKEHFEKLARQIAERKKDSFEDIEYDKHKVPSISEYILKITGYGYKISQKLYDEKLIEIYNIYKNGIVISILENYKNK